MSGISALAIDIEDELRAKNLANYVLRKESNVEEIIIEIYENQSWHPVLQTWGSVVGVHLNAVIDRSPYTDETGTKVLHGSLSEVKPLNKFKWQGEWVVRVDQTTDNAGFQYATSWSLLSNKYKPSTSTSSLMYVRRRRFTRKMVVDPDPPSKALPYELTIKVRKANVQGLGLITHSYIEVFLDHTFLDRTSAGSPDWNHKLTKKIMEIDPEMTITFVLYTKKTFTVVNPFQSGQAPIEMIHRGTAHIIIQDFLQNLTLLNKEEEIDLISPTGVKCGTLLIRLDMLETKLFSVVSAVEDSMEQLEKRTEEALPTDIRYDISSLDNDDNCFLKVLVKNVIEGRDVMTEADLVDIVSEAGYLQNVDTDQFDERNGKPKTHKQTMRYPSGKPRYSKVITLPSTMVDRNNVSIIRSQLTRALVKEEELQAINERFDDSLPAVSSIFEPQTLGVNGYDLAYQPSQQDSAKSEYYDLAIYCLPEDGVDSDVAHMLRWTSYYDYVMMIREMVKIQHQYYRDEAVNDVVRHTCKVLYGAAVGKNPQPTNWIPVSFTVDSEAEFLVIRESRVAREDQTESFDKIISFDQVDGIVVKNTYHLSHHYALEVRVHAASSMHLRDTIANIHIESTDGRQRYTFKSEPFRKGSAPAGQPGTVTFDDSYTFMLPPSVLNPRRDQNARECLHMTFSSDENTNTDTSAVYGSMDLPLSSILPAIGSNMSDCQVIYRNKLQEYELHLRVLCINNLLWKGSAAANLFSMDFNQGEDAADPYYAVYFADENGQIIPLREGGGAAAVVQDLASNLVYLSTAGMVGNKSEGGASVVGNVARDLMYLGTAGMVGGKGDGKKPLLSHHQQSMQEEGGHHSAGSSLGSVANNLVYLSTAGTFGKAKDPLKSNSAHGTPGKAQGGGLLSSLSNHGNRSTSDLQRATSKTSSDNGAAGRRPQLDRRNSANVGNPASMVGSAASGLISLGAAGIQGTSNVIVGTSNVAVNVLTLGNAGIVSSMNKADAIFISPVVNKSLNPTWDDEIVISTEQYGDLMRQAKYLLIEVWNKNTAFADECLGEVYVPIVCAHRVEPQSNLDRVPRTTGMKKYPVQLSKHMKINRTAAKRLPNGLGSMRTQLLHREIRPPRGATSKELGEDDPIKVNLLVQMKPVGALDYAWPSRVISSEATADTMESDTLFVRLKHDGLHLSVSLPTQLPYSDRIKMLLECREKSKATTSGGDKNCLVMIVPYDQLFISTCAILTTDALQCSVTLTRLVTSSTQKGKELERPVTLDLLIGPCPACDVYSILQQRVSLTEYRAPLKAIAGIQVPIDKVNDIARDLQQEILAVSHDLEDMSVRTNATPVLENILNNNSGTNTTNTTTTSKTTESNIIFADQISRMSVTYFCTKLHARVLMVQKAFLKTYLWYTLEFSNFSVAKIVGKTILPNFDKEIDIDYITILTKRARSMLKYGDYNKLSDGTDSDDSSDDENNEKIQKRKEKKNISTTSIVTRIKTIMVELSKDVHNILFQGYRRKYTPAYVQFLCSKLIYEQYLVIVGYLANILLEHSEQAAIPTGNNSNNNVNDKSLTSQVLQLTSLATNVMTLGTIKINTNNNNIHLNNHTNKNTNSFDAQKKHELISFVLSQDNLFECYLHSNLFCFDYKFSCRPHLSMCLDFDVLITKFSDLLNENIQMWNSKALKVFMCRKIEEGVAPSRLPWDITTLKDDQSNNDLYISHIPESIQIQLNVQIGMKKINTKGMGDNLSIMSIKRIYDINLRIAKAIARAYLSLAVEYDNFLEETTNALAVTEVGAGDRVKSIITNFGAKMLEVGTLGVLNVNDITTTGTTGNKDENTTQEESDELLCFLMSIVNDCRRINKEHIPQSIASFVKEFTDSNTDTLVQQQTRKRSTSSKDNSSIHGGRHNTTTSSTTPTLTATEEINNYFFNPIKAIKAVSRNAINCLTNQVFFHGDLREYFLHTFAEHMLIKTQSSTLLSLVKVVGNTAMNASSSTATLDKSSGNNGGDASPVDRENETVEIEEKDNAVSTIVATLQDMYSFTASHVGIEDQNRIIYNCLKKLIMRYLLMLRDILLIKNTSRLSSALNTGINSSINTGMMMGRTVLQLTTLGLAGGNESTDNMSDLDRSTSTVHTTITTAAESYTPIQITAIRTDLETIMHAHLDVTDDKVAELLQYFNKSVNAILQGTTCDPRMIDQMLTLRFHQNPPVFSTDPSVYDRSLESFIGLSAATHELTQEELEKRMNKHYTVQFQDLTCVNLKDYRLCVVRITFASITLQSSILSTDMVGSAQIRWKDILRFEHVKGYANKEVLVELVEVRPMGLRREMVLARLRIQLSALSQFITPEPYPAHTGGKIVSSPHAGHSGWFVLEEVAADLTTTKGLTNMLRGATTSTLQTTMNVTSSTLQTTMNVTSSAVNTMMTPLRSGSEEGDTLGGSSTGKDSSTSKASATTKPTTTAAVATAKAKNSYLSVLSSDQPRENVAAPQLKIRIRIVEELD